MFNIVKWAYQRGVAHERLRIKRLIAEFYMQSETELTQRNLWPRPDTDEKKSEKLRQLEHKTEVNAEVRRILDKLVTPGESEWVPKSPAPIDEGSDD